ncbi:hypothetical protein TTRE_0000494201 [Trichuris trichiura]|uniref:Uncharacterized protein n=1 Tax=Trichuris trichiura TaxID=36087 RepID=A0A077ZDH2_TRITR|nr:hypothetical protein TTRE_0000494201 [Trichuris trichiura]
MCSLKHHDHLSFCYVIVNAENANLKKLWEHEKSWHEIEVRVKFKDLPPGMKQAKAKVPADDKTCVKPSEKIRKKEEEGEIADAAVKEGKKDKPQVKTDIKIEKPEESGKKEAIDQAAVAQCEKEKPKGTTEVAQKLAVEVKEIEKEIYENKRTDAQQNVFKSVEQVEKQFKQTEGEKEAESGTKGITEVRQAYESMKKVIASENDDKNRQNIGNVEVYGNKLPENQDQIKRQAETNKIDEKSKTRCEDKLMEREISKATVKEQASVQPTDKPPLNVCAPEKAEAGGQEQQVCKGYAKEQASMDPVGKSPRNVLSKEQTASNFAKTMKGGVSLQNAPLEAPDEQLQTPDQSELRDEMIGWKTRVRNAFHKGSPGKQKKPE